jgi:hypothetical protein
MYQAVGMYGVLKSIRMGWNWVWNLYRGPVKKVEDVPQRRLLMVPPPVSPNRPAPVMQFQSV